MKGDGIPLTPVSGALLPRKDLFAGLLDLAARVGLERQGAFADDDRGAADVRCHQVALIDLELHAHPAGPVHLPALVAYEGRGILAELAEIPKVGGEHGVRIAADRVLGDAEWGTEHARFRGPRLRVAIT